MAVQPPLSPFTVAPKSGRNAIDARISANSRFRRDEWPLVAALAYDRLCTFEFAIAAEIFAMPRPELGEDWYRFAVCAAEPGPLRAFGGLSVEPALGLELLAEADLIIIPGWKGVDAPVPPKLSSALTAAHERGARIASICSGAFVLAAAGLLDGKRAATHWRYADSLQRLFPRVQVEASVLYVEDNRILTSAGSAAGIDLMLHIIRSDFGADAANCVARRLVVQPHRSGGQAQFVHRPLPSDPRRRFATLLDEVRADPARNWSVPAMARHAAMSERTFFRRFTDSTGCSPAEWLSQLRVEECKRLLEATALPVDEVARQSGFGTVETLRQHFARATKLTPSEYRQRFGHRTDEMLYRD
jgi:AraC family transcriptional activator FtrA